MDQHKNRQRKSLSTPVHNGSRRQSITAQLTRSARRFSAAVIPQFTKLDPLPILQKYRCLKLRILNIHQLQTAIERYVVSNNVCFEPIDFEITDDMDAHVLNASLYPDEMVLNEGSRRILSLSFFESDGEEEGTILSRIKHPISGMRVFDFVEHNFTNNIHISSYIDQSDRCHVEPVSSSWLRLLLFCGCIFSKFQWHFKQENKILAAVKPNESFFDENSFRIEWNEQADSELRLIVVAFALTQMVREAFPSLIHILKEHRSRRTD